MVSIEIPPNWPEEDRRWLRRSLACPFISSSGKRWGQPGCIEYMLMERGRMIK